jgi:hypothetical protein
MRNWLARIRGAVLMALTWAVIWAPFGPLAGMILDPDGRMDEPWVLVGAGPGFLCGLIFSTVLAITERHRSIQELSPARVAVWGAAGGFLLMMLLNTSLLGTPNTEHLFWRARWIITAGVTLLSAASAAGSLLLARMAKKREAPETSDVA